jgi:uncharacterized protein
LSELVLSASDITLLSLLILGAAALYSSVGHGGASGYLAAMALFGMAPTAMKPTALTLNILVSAIAMTRFYRAGAFSWRIFLMFSATSVPFAFAGGMITLPGTFYRKIIGLVLLYAAFQLVRISKQPKAEPRPVPVLPALLFGAGIGFLSGLTGVGGGIFIGPLLLFTGWADPRQTAGVSAAFIFVNSISGLMGHVASIKSLPPYIGLLAVAAIAGGFLGAWVGSGILSKNTLRRLLAAVLVIAAIKFIVF